MAIASFGWALVDMAFSLVKNALWRFHLSLYVRYGTQPGAPNLEQATRCGARCATQPRLGFHKFNFFITLCLDAWPM